MTWMLVLLAACAVTDEGGKVDPKTYWHHAPVETAGAAEGFVSLELPPEVLDRMLPTHGDARLADGANNVIPYLLRKVPPARRAARAALRDLKPVVLEDGNTALEGELKEPVGASSLTLSLSEGGGEELSPLPLRVEAREGQEAWSVLAEGNYPLESAGDGGAVRIAFPARTVRAVRLVYPAGDRLWRGALVRQAFFSDGDATVPAHQRLVELRAADAVKPDKDIPAGVTVHEWKTPRNLPVESVRPHFRGDWYERGCIVSCGDMPGRGLPTQWRGLASGAVSRRQYHGHPLSSNELSAGLQTGALLRLNVTDGDNPPLVLDRVELRAARMELIFRNEPGRAYTLHFGRERAARPEYDLARVVEGLNAPEFPRVALGAVVYGGDGSNPADLPWTERNRYVLWGGMAVIMVIMMAVLVANLRGEAGKGGTP